MSDQTEKRNCNPYADIMNLPRHVSVEREHMSLYDRAAQFSPFAALTGFEGAIRETARLTDHKIELDETQKTILDEKLRILREQMGEKQETAESEFVYFRPDDKKVGGEYITVRGVVSKMDTHGKTIILQDGSRIPVDEIVDITGDLFQSVDNFFA